MRPSIPAAIAVAIISAVSVVPVVYLVFGSFSGAAGFFKMPPRLLASPSLENWRWVFALEGISVWAVNTVLVAAGTAILSAATSFSAGYAFSFHQFPGKPFLWWLILAGLSIPRVSLVIPLFVTCRKLGIAGTMWAAILPSVFLPGNILLARRFFDGFPRSLIEAARLDGASEAQILRMVVGPASGPIIAALVVLSSVASMSDWMWQALQLQDPGRQTLLVGLMRAATLRSNSANDVNPVGHSMAAATLLLLPMLAIFLAARKHFIGSLEGAERG